MLRRGKVSANENAGTEADVVSAALRQAPDLLERLATVMDDDDLSDENREILRLAALVLRGAAPAVPSSSSAAPSAPSEVGAWPADPAAPAAAPAAGRSEGRVEGGERGGGDDQ